MLAFIEILIKIGSEMNVLERHQKKYKKNDFFARCRKLTFLKSQKFISEILDLNASNQFRTNSGRRREGFKF